MIPLSNITKADVLAGRYRPEPHPVLPMLTREQVIKAAERIGWPDVLKAVNDREGKIIAETNDPYRHGCELAIWKDADQLFLENDELCILGGNRSSKTEYAAKRLVLLMCNMPDSRVFCLRDTELCSITLQQPVIYKYLPPEFKTAKKTKVTNISWTSKNGFSEGRFVLPNGAMCCCMNWSMDSRVFEGIEADLIWCDELVPFDLLETLRYRIVTRRGKILLTFTPRDGWTPVVKDFIQGAKLIDSRPAPLLADTVNVPGCPRGQMPYRMKCMAPGRAVIFFHSEFNPFSPFEQLKKTLYGRGPYEKKIRAYGWADCLAGSQFPRFGEGNLVAPDKVPPAGTRYMVIDPAGARNWFMLWLIVDDLGRRFVYREWPDISWGEWAVVGEDGTKTGPGQRNGAGRGHADYRQLIVDLEKDEKISERFIDPRAGGTKTILEDGGVTLIELLAQKPNPLYVQAAAGLRTEDGISIINDWLSYNPGEPVTVLNEPKLYISRACENLIFALKEYTGREGEKEATKDPIDCLRYLAVQNCGYAETNLGLPGKRGSY